MAVYINICVKSLLYTGGEGGVEIFNFGEILTKAGFSNPPHAGEPDNRSPIPCAFEQFQPESPVYYTKL
jgi:hypothetical protein